MLVRASGSSGFPQRQLANPSLIPNEMGCPPVALPPRGNATVFARHETGLTCVNDAWKFLIAHGASLALTHGINPQDPILVTRSLRIDDHQVEDWRPSLLPVPDIGRATGFGPATFCAPAFPQRGGFGASPAFPHHGFGAHAPAFPSMVYLITSSRPDFAAYITDDPMGCPRASDRVHVVEFQLSVWISGSIR